MKYLTKKWSQLHEKVRSIYCLKEYDEQKETFDDIQRKSREEFFNILAMDEEMLEAVDRAKLKDDFYQAKIVRDSKTFLSLPKEIYSKIKEINMLVLGYACKEDKELLMDYANELLKELETLSNQANNTTEIAEDYLSEKFTLDELVGEIVYEEYTNGKDYILNIDGIEICIENYEIIERENFKINEWEEDNPLTLWTNLEAAELHYISDNCFELHLLLLNGDLYENKKFWYFTLRGTNIRYV